MERGYVILFLIICFFNSGNSYPDLKRDPPEAHYTPLQLIKTNSYPGEEYNVTTSDGYILTMQRIPHGRKGNTNGTKPVIFLQHGLLCSSTNWLSNGIEDSFAFLLADAGFDVWMGNVRGNTYSRHHVKLNPDKDRQYWEFSFDEHSLIDLPTMIDFALSISGQEKLYYVGHSQGTMMGFAGFSHNQTLASKIIEFYALAPVTTVSHIKGLFLILARTRAYKILEPLLDIVGVGEFVPNKSFIVKIGEDLCKASIKEICGGVIFLICGFDEKNLDYSRIPIYLGHTPAGTSVQNMNHWSQMINSGKFQMYDYGCVESNEQHYNGSSTPHFYDVTKLTVPTFLFSGSQDWLADPQDVAELIPKIQGVIKNHINIPYYEHLDFIWGIDAATKVYKVIIDDIKNNLEIK